MCHTLVTKWTSNVERSWQYYSDDDKLRIRSALIFRREGIRAILDTWRALSAAPIFRGKAMLLDEFIPTKTRECSHMLISTTRSMSLKVYNYTPFGNERNSLGARLGRAPIVAFAAACQFFVRRARPHRNFSGRARFALRTHPGGTPNGIGTCQRSAVLAALCLALVKRYSINVTAFMTAGARASTRNTSFS